MKKIVFISVLMIIFSCKKNTSEGFVNPENLPFEKIIVDKNIKNASEFSKLNHLNEITFPFKNPKDTVRIKKSTDVYAVSKSTDKKEKSFFFNFYKCRAYFEKKNLIISLFSNNAFGSNGNNLLLSKEKFSLRPFRSNDIGGNEKNDFYKINSQTLVLNNNNYKVGDSIFGKIDAEVLRYTPEVNEKYKDEIFHVDEKIYTKKIYGFFRAKVEESVIPKKYMKK